MAEPLRFHVEVEWLDDSHLERIEPAQALDKIMIQAIPQFIGYLPPDTRRALRQKKPIC